MTVDKAGIGKPDGTTITVDEDGTLHGQSKVDAMTGATAEKDGTSGTVPAPKVGQQDMYLAGDATYKKIRVTTSLDGIELGVSTSGCLTVTYDNREGE